MDFAYTALDYGVTVVALLVMGGMLFMFIKFLTNHMSDTTDVLKNLVEQSQLHTDTIRGLADEFHRLTDEERALRSEIRYAQITQGRVRHEAE